MPSRSLPIRLSRSARNDFVDILRYTKQTWGARQMAVYQRRIDEALRAISCNPELGHKRQDLPSAHRAYLVGVHLIVYRVDGEGLGVVRILHQRMSLARWVPDT